MAATDTAAPTPAVVAAAGSAADEDSDSHLDSELVELENQIAALEKDFEIENS